MLKVGSETPWGPAQTVEQVAEGVEFVSTAGHGGFWVSLPRRRTWALKFQQVRPFAGVAGWYEEDCDWAVVVLAMPHLFDERQKLAAVQTCESVDYLRHLVSAPAKFTIGFGSQKVGEFILPAEGDKS